MEQGKRICLQLIMDEITNIKIVIIKIIRYGTDIAGKNNSNNKPQQQDKIHKQQVFECLTNTIPPTHNTIQDLKFGVYSLVV